jgi:hypothetical protein
LKFKLRTLFIVITTICCILAAGIWIKSNLEPRGLRNPSGYYIISGIDLYGFDYYQVENVPISDYNRTPFQGYFDFKNFGIEYDVLMFDHTLESIIVYGPWGEYRFKTVDGDIYAE